MRQHDSSQWRELGDRVARLADALAGCATRAIQLGTYPPTAVVIAERDLWRWAETLRRTHGGQPAAAGQGGHVAVALLVAVDGYRDPTAVADAIVRAAGQAGGWWRIRHATTYPDPAAIFGATIPTDPDRDEADGGGRR